MDHGKVKFAKGIEIGQIFKLGTIYSEKMNGTYLDENGIIWPKEVAPYLVHLVCLDMKKDVQKETAEKIYNKLLEEKVEVLYDDRIERPGVKFNDADLIGLPIQIIVGRKADEGIVEIKVRKTGEREEVLIENLYKKLHEIIENLA